MGHGTKNANRGRAILENKERVKVLARQLGKATRETTKAVHELDKKAKWAADQFEIMRAQMANMSSDLQWLLLPWYQRLWYWVMALATSTQRYEVMATAKDKEAQRGTVQDVRSGDQLGADEGDREGDAAGPETAGSGGGDGRRVGGAAGVPEPLRDVPAGRPAPEGEVN